MYLILFNMKTYPVAVTIIQKIALPPVSVVATEIM